MKKKMEEQRKKEEAESKPEEISDKIITKTPDAVQQLLNSSPMQIEEE